MPYLHIFEQALYLGLQLASFSLGHAVSGVLHGILQQEIRSHPLL